MLSKNKGSKKAKSFKIIGLILIVLAVLGIGPAILMGAGCPACGAITVIVLLFLNFPLLLAGISLVLWGRYFSLISKKRKIIAIIFTLVFLIWIFRIIGYFSFEYYLAHYLPQKTERITAEVIKSKNVEKCYRNIRVPIYFSLFHNFFFIEYFEYRVTPLQAECVTALAVTDQNETICDSLPETGYPQTLYKAQCYIKVAVEKRDLNVCHRMYEMKKEYTGDCYRRVIEILKGLQEKGTFVLDEAVKEFAIERRDSRICSGAGIYRLDCEEEIKRLIE